MTFSFHRGSLALDFVGTVGGRTSAKPEERMPNAAAFGEWLVESGLLAAAHPKPVEFERAVALREAIYRVALAMLANTSLPTRALAVLNGAADGRKLGAPRLTGSGHMHWPSRAPIDTALARVAVDAIERLAKDARRLTVCEFDGCGALLLSNSRSDKRRWCSMERCGNRAKAAAHRTRQRDPGETLRSES